MGKKFYAMMAVLAFAAGGMDVNAVYTLDGIEVSADRQKDRFGNMITEQSYYRTGGDVQVIDSDTIEKRHYTQVGDALKYIPGVQVQTPEAIGAANTDIPRHIPLLRLMEMPV